MFRNSLIAAVAVMALSGSLWAGELDNERSGSPAAQASTFKGSGDVLGTVVTSEMDKESPTQAWWHRHYGYRHVGYYGGGGGFYRASYYGGGGGFYRASYYGGGYGGGYYRASYYGGGYGGGYVGYPVGGCW